MKPNNVHVRKPYGTSAQQPNLGTRHPLLMGLICPYFMVCRAVGECVWVGVSVALYIAGMLQEQSYSMWLAGEAV